MHKASAVVALIVGALAVMAVGSYATADSGKKNVKSDPMSGYLEGAPGPVSTAASGVVRGDYRRWREGDPLHDLL